MATTTPAHALVWRDGHPNCQDCGTRGNITMDSDRVYRCHGCSRLAYYAKSVDDPSVKPRFEADAGPCFASPPTHPELHCGRPLGHDGLHECFVSASWGECSGVELR